MVYVYEYLEYEYLVKGFCGGLRTVSQPVLPPQLPSLPAPKANGILLRTTPLWATSELHVLFVLEGLSVINLNTTLTYLKNTEGIYIQISNCII